MAHAPGVYRLPIAETGLMVASLLLSGCGGGESGDPNFASFSGAPPDSVLAYVDTLEFNTRYGAGDEQRLLIGTYPGSSQYGPLAEIQPQVNSHKIQLSNLEIGDKGRVIARLINKDTSTSYLSKYNLGAHDTVLWVVDSVHPDSLGFLRGRSMFFSIQKLRASDTNSFISKPLEVDTHYTYAYKQALARWIWHDSDETSWGTCSKGACCR